MAIATKSKKHQPRVRLSVFGTDGAGVRNMMRDNGITIRELAQRLGLPMNRVRRAREKGLGFLATIDWLEACRGTSNGRGLTDRERAALRQYIRQMHEYQTLG